MTDQHQPAVPLAIEQVVDRLSELEVVLGDPARAALPRVREHLVAAMAARDRGDPPAAVALIGRAMEELAGLADRLDPAEALLMRALAQRFRAALVRGDEATAKEAAELMLDQSGTRKRPKS
jgi:hypothetical protein